MVVLKTAAMDTISDCVLLKILSYLAVKELIKCCLICKKWKRVAYDSSLWNNVDLRPFRLKLDEHEIIRLVQLRFKPFLKRINLSGFSLTPKIFLELQKHCPFLNSLVLENVTFIGFNSTPAKAKRFPNNLELLDLRYTTGDEDAFRLIVNKVSQIKYLGVSNSLIANSNEVELFRNLVKVEILDFSYCSALYDTTLIMIGTFCTNLVSLSFSHCNNMRGSGLDWVVKNCEHLKSLSINGTSLQDENLIECDWSKIRLEELDISWCRNITETGLKRILPHLLTLKYLRLCSCGFGHALTDQVLTVLSSNRFSELQTIDLSYSREITDNGVARLIQELPALKQIRVSCCRKLTVELVDKSASDKNDLILASFHDEHARYVSLGQPNIHFLADEISTDDNRTLSFQSQMLRYWG